MLGAVEDMLPVMTDLDVVLLTSRSEGLPVSLIEAAAAGLPAVATPVGGVPELVEHERTGFLGSTADELAHGLAQLLDAPAERLACGQRARIRATARHGAEGLARRLVEVYTVALAERRGGPE
jgi:glycosyltransferase involved in cell wall biosynthesis